MAFAESIKIGMRGEQLAARELRNEGFTVIAANFLTELGETDLIALDRHKTLCFIEVKTRSPGAYFPPSAAVDAAKRRRLINNAKAFIKISDEKYRGIEFDIMEVILHDLYFAEFNLMRNVFGQEDI